MSRTPAPHAHRGEEGPAVVRALTLGLAVSIGAMAVGAVLAVFTPGPRSHEAMALAELPGGLAAGRPVAFFSLGILLLLATPALRLAVLLYETLRRRDWLFASIAAFVLAVLLVSAFLGKK